MNKNHSLIGFPIAFLPLVRCTHDGAQLQLQEGHTPAQGSEEAVADGTVACTRCGTTFPIQGGILNLLKGAVEDPLSATEQRQRDERGWTVPPQKTPAEVTSHAIEMAATLEALPVRPADKLLELGCGEGRYTLELAGRADILAVDFSIQLLRALQDRLPPGARRIGLVLGDVTTLSLAPQRFDYALSTLTSNLPSREHREKLYRLARMALAPTGRFVFSGHFQGIRQKLTGQAKSGTYKDGGIYRYNFCLHEGFDEVGPHFASVDAHPIQIYLPLSRTLRLPLPALSRMAERIPVLRSFGNLLLVKADAPRPLPAAAAPA